MNVLALLRPLGAHLGIVLASVVWSLGQAVVGVLYPAASRRVERLQRATALLLLASIVCLGMGLGIWHSGIAWSGAWFVWLIGAASLLAAGILGSCVEAAAARPATLPRLPFEQQTARD
jgi:hypothetical protein